MMKHKTLAVAGLSVAALLLAACGGGGDPLGQQSSAAPSGSGASGPVLVGSANFTESTIIAEIYSQALAAKGIESSTKLNIGSREVYIKALQDSSISVVPEYTGNLLGFVDEDTTAKSAEEVEAALPDALPDGLEVLKSSTAVDQDVYVVSKEFSEKNGVTSLADLAKVADGVTVAGFSELEERDYGPKGLTSVYGVKVKEFKPYDSAELMAEELNKGNVDVADLFTTASAISRNQLVQLEDPEADDPAAERDPAGPLGGGGEHHGHRRTGRGPGRADHRGPDRAQLQGRRRPAGSRPGRQGLADQQGPRVGRCRHLGTYPG